MNKWIFMLPLMAVFAGCQKEIKVACVGDSITESACINNEATGGYPALLDSMLGDGYSVLNAGRGWATVSKCGDVPYWSRNEFHNVFAYQPDIIVIKLGTNDSKAKNWNTETFPVNLQALIDTFKQMPSHPKIYLCYPAKSYALHSDIRDSVIANGIIPAIQKVAEANKIQVIDLHSLLSNHPEVFADSIHPNNVGYRMIAEEVTKYIKKK
jgi:alpha-L-fucosidase 2